MIPVDFYRFPGFFIVYSINYVDVVKAIRIENFLAGSCFYLLANCSYWICMDPINQITDTHQFCAP
jgi:hypothetical protein